MLYIGKDVQDRMDLLGLTVFDFSMICSVLHCQEDFLQILKHVKKICCQHL